MKFFRRLLLLFFALYLLPAFASATYWVLKDRPQSWREANWTSSGLLAPAAGSPEAAIYVFSAKTGGMKGAVSSHSWIVTKEKNATSYKRYDKVGWGAPIRRDGYAADAFWYSNPPQLVAKVSGREAEALIGKVEAAIGAYPYQKAGGYRIYPGPNSNTFVAHVLRSVPELGAVLPPDAVGRDYLPDGRLFHIDQDGLDLHASLYGLAGFSAGLRSGIEIHLLGLVAGLDLGNPGIKVPALGRFGF